MNMENYDFLIKIFQVTEYISCNIDGNIGVLRAYEGDYINTSRNAMQYTFFIGNSIFHLSLELLTKFWKKRA